MRTEQQDGYYALNKTGYIVKIMERFGHDNAIIPLDPAYVKQKEEEEPLTIESYRSLYVAVNSRPDICLSVSLLRRYMFETDQPGLERSDADSKVPDIAEAFLFSSRIRK